MAKRKNSTALFEVYARAQTSSKPRPVVSPRPGFFAGATQWFKRPASEAEVKPAAGATPATSPAAILPGESLATDRTAASKPIQIEMEEPSPAADPVDDAAPVSVAVDPEERRISLQMSYRGAAIAAGLVVVVVGLVIFTSLRTNRNNVTLLARETTTQLRQGQPHPDVMIPTRHDLMDEEQPRSTAGSPRNDTPQNSPRQGDARTSSPLSPPDGKRFPGLNYVIIQSYPQSEEKLAREAAALLNKEGISCTVETNVKGFQAITVVSLSGFPKISTPSYQNYIARIQQVSAKLTSNSRSFKALTPVAKKWEKAE